MALAVTDAVSKKKKKQQKGLKALAKSSSVRELSNTGNLKDAGLSSFGLFHAAEVDVNLSTNELEDKILVLPEITALNLAEETELSDGLEREIGDLSDYDIGEHVRCIRFEGLTVAHSGKDGKSAAMPPVLIRKPEYSYGIGQAPKENILLHGDFGNKVSPSAEVLARFLMTNPKYVAGKRVCELGSGLGLVGMSVACSGKAKSVVLTDGDPTVVDGLQKTVKCNVTNGTVEELADADTSSREVDDEADISHTGTGESLATDLPLRTPVKAIQFEWGETRMPTCLRDGVDLVVAADCVYSPGDCQLFLQSVKRILRPGGCAIVCSPPRLHSLDHFQRMARNQFTLTPLGQGQSTTAAAAEDSFVNNIFRRRKCHPKIFQLRPSGLQPIPSLYKTGSIYEHGQMFLKRKEESLKKIRESIPRPPLLVLSQEEMESSSNRLSAPQQHASTVADDPTSKGFVLKPTLSSRPATTSFGLENLPVGEFVVPGPRTTRNRPPSRDRGGKVLPQSDFGWPEPPKPSGCGLWSYEQPRRRSFTELLGDLKMADGKIYHPRAPTAAKPSSSRPQSRGRKKRHGKKGMKKRGGGVPPRTCF